MGTRGKKSAEALSVVTVLPERPRPPAELNGQERDIWNAVVNSHQGGWITKDAYPVLIQYARHAVRALRIAQLIQQEEDADDFNPDRWAKLLDLQNRESKTILALARAMRLTHQSRYRADSSKARPQSGAPRPWDP